MCAVLGFWTAMDSTGPSLTLCVLFPCLKAPIGTASNWAGEVRGKGAKQRSVFSDPESRSRIVLGGSKPSLCRCHPETVQGKWRLILKVKIQNLELATGKC